MGSLHRIAGTGDCSRLDGGKRKSSVPVGGHATVAFEFRMGRLAYGQGDFKKAKDFFSWAKAPTAIMPVS